MSASIAVNETCGQRRANRSNAAWGAVEYAAQAISLLCLTPLLINHLGQSSFGLLVIATTITGLNGVFSLGMGPATQHFVAKYRETSRTDSLAVLVETSLCANFCVGSIAGIIVLALSKLVPLYAGEPMSADGKQLLTIVSLSALALPFVFLANTLDNTLRGFEEFNRAVPISAITRILTTITQILLVLSGHSIVAVVASTVVFQVVQSVVAWLVTKLLVLHSLRLVPRFSWMELKKFFSYGIYVWLTSMIGTLRNSGEMLILASIVGPAMLTIYAVPSRLLTQTHLLLSKVFSYVFPYATKLIVSRETKKVHQLYCSGTRYLCTLSSLAIPPLAICCGPALAFWLDEAVATQVQPILQILSIRFAVFPLSILTSNLLLAAGETRVMTLVIAINTALVLPLTTILAWNYGVRGAACAQLAVFIPIIFNRYYIERKLFGLARFATVAQPVLLITIPLICMLCFINIPIGFSPFLTLLVGIGVASISASICWFLMDNKGQPTIAFGELQ